MRERPDFPVLSEAVLLQQFDDHLVTLSKRGPYGPAPCVDSRVSIRSRRRSEYIGDTHASAILWKGNRRQLTPSLSELHVHLLDPPAGILLLNAQVKTHKGDYKADRLGVFARRLRAERIHHMLQNERRPPHRVDVQLVVRVTGAIHQLPVARVPVARASTYIHAFFNEASVTTTRLCAGSNPFSTC